MAKRTRDRDFSNSSLEAWSSDLFTARPFTTLQLFEDRRQWHPEGLWRPAQALPRSAARVMAPAFKSGSARPAKLYTMRFEAPADVAICVRRKTRKEVLFAKRKTRKGSSSPKRRSFHSRIGC